MAKWNTRKIPQEGLPELVVQILDTFEDYLEEKDITIDKPDKQEAIVDGEDLDSICILYGIVTTPRDINSILYVQMNWACLRPIFSLLSESQWVQ